MAEKNSNRDINQIIKYLTNVFVRATKHLGTAERTKNGPNRAYQYQTEFAYLINEITMCVPCMVQTNIAACNSFIDSVYAELNKEG